jgi:hypothetical protein
VSISSAELASEKRLNKIPGDGRSNRPATHTNDIHIVILDSLLSREMIVNECGADADNLVGANGGANAAAADCYTANYITRGYSSGKRNYYVRIVVFGIQLMGAEIDDIMPRCAQLPQQLFFESESPVIGGYSYSHLIILHRLQSLRTAVRAAFQSDIPVSAEPDDDADIIELL